MASGRKVAEVFVEVRANLSKLKSGMKSAMSIASGGASVIGKVLGGLASLIKNVLTAAFKVVGAVIKTVFNLVSALFSSIIKWAKRGVLALSAFVALSVVVGAKFGQSMARVKALTGASTKEFKALREEARRLGRATEYSANEAADAMSIFAMAGFKTNDVITAMTPTLDFAAASGLDLASAADIAARVMGGMQLEAKDLSHTMDVLTKAFTSANMDATDLGEAMKYVGAVGKTVGKDVEEIVGTLTALAAAGNRGAMAGTGLRKVLMGLATSDVQDRLEGLGVSVTDTAGAMKPMSKLIGDLVKATKQMSDMEIADLGVAMFGARGGVAFLQLIGQGEAAIEKYTKQLANVNGFTKQIAATQRDTLATAFKIVQSAIADVMISVTDILEPALLKATDSQVKMWNKVGEVLEKNKKGIQDFIENTITWIKTNLPRAINIGIGSIANLWDEFKSTFDGIKELVSGTATSVGESLGNFFEFDSQTGTMIERVVASFLIGMLKIKQAIVDIFARMKQGIYEMELIRGIESGKAKMAMIEWLNPKRKEGEPVAMRSPFDLRPFIATLLDKGATEKEVESLETQLRLHRDTLGFEADMRNEEEMAALNETIRIAFGKEGDQVVKALENTEKRGANIVGKVLKDAGATFFGIKTTTREERREARIAELDEFMKSLVEKLRGVGKFELGETPRYQGQALTEERKRLVEAFHTAATLRASLQNQAIDEAKPSERAVRGEMSRHGGLWFQGQLDILGIKKKINDLMLGKGGRDIKLPDAPKLGGGFATTIQTAIGSAKVGATDELVTIGRKIAKAIDDAKALAQDTADNTLATAENTSEVPIT